MIRVNIYARYNQQKAIGAVKELPKILSNLLSHDDVIIKPEEISARSMLITGNGSMVTDNEVEIIANKDDYFIEKKDEICKQVADALRENTKIKDCCVWLILSDVGHFIYK